MAEIVLFPFAPESGEGAVTAAEWVGAAVPMFSGMEVPFGADLMIPEQYVWPEVKHRQEPSKTIENTGGEIIMTTLNTGGQQIDGTTQVDRRVVDD